MSTDTLRRGISAALRVRSRVQTGRTVDTDDLATMQRAASESTEFVERRPESAFSTCQLSSAQRTRALREIDSYIAQCNRALVQDDAEVRRFLRLIFTPQGVMCGQAL